MAKIIRSLYDKEGNSVLPITSISAIFDSNGVRLDKLLDGFGIASDQFEDFEPKEDTFSGVVILLSQHIRSVSWQHFAIRRPLPHSFSLRHLPRT